MVVNVGIVGSRRRNTKEDKLWVKLALEHLITIYGRENIIIVSGGCPTGADKFAEDLQKELGLPKPIIYYPDKSQLKSQARYEWRKICYARNTLIAQDADILLACVAPDRKGGTEDTIKKYKAFGKDKLILI